MTLNPGCASLLLLSCSVLSDSCDPMDCSLPGSSVHGVFQARILEWVVISFFDPRIKPMSPTLAGGFFTTELPGKPHVSLHTVNKPTCKGQQHSGLAHYAAGTLPQLTPGTRDMVRLFYGHHPNILNVRKQFFCFVLFCSVLAGSGVGAIITDRPTPGQGTRSYILQLRPGKAKKLAWPNKLKKKKKTLSSRPQIYKWLKGQLIVRVY